MSTMRWRGDASKIAQIDSLTPANVEVSDVFIATINGKTVSFTATAATVANVTAGLAAAWNASTYAEFMEITASDQTTYVKLTADTAGKPFTVTASATDGGGANTQTLTRAAVTANSGPNDAGVAANYSGGVLPANGDTLYFDAGSSDCKYSLDALASVNPANVFILSGYSGNIGLPAINTDNASNSYFEYRPAYLQLGGGTGAIAMAIAGTGGRIKIDCGAAVTTWNVSGTGTRAERDVPALLLKGTSGSNALNINKGDAAVAWFGGETSALGTLNVGYQSNVAGDVQLVLGSGVTLTNTAIVQTGGRLELNSSLTGTGSLTQSAGTSVVWGTAALAQLTLLGGNCVYNSSGTLGGNTVIGGTGSAVLDFSQDLRAKTVTNPIDIYGSKGSLLDPNKVVGSLIVDLDQISNGSLISIGTNIRLTRGAVA